ncbi:MAG: GNAT family N-acetyltransferase [Polymorphobacter sp.]|uniref:GNAT family N-acetyltransferase n=1 Tax=Polymorphobacter sp. TaxID=1909290 RepID=UPI003A8C8165
MADIAGLKARIVHAAADIDAAAWDACAGTINPFTTHAFINALETSGSATARTGWQPAHIVLETEAGDIEGIMPAYAKSHSQGEYVFDHNWADAYERAGGRYYPKLQCAVPFTPATGPRLLARTPEAARALISTAEGLARANDLSSIHATFLTPEEQVLFREAGWLMRSSEQFHWFNQNYTSFDDFLGQLASAKRKNIRKERARAIEGLDIVHLQGPAITEADWDAFWVFYQDTGMRKWGRPYLTRSFFSTVGETMGDRVLLMLAKRDGQPIAGALNFIGEDCLYGRYWGCTEHVPGLHFELCYYQAIEWAIAHGRPRVEAGAQGAHKLARGYRPVATISAHYIPNAGFSSAIADFVAREARMIDADIEALDMATPFRRGSPPRPQG